MSRSRNYSPRGDEGRVPYYRSVCTYCGKIPRPSDDGSVCPTHGGDKHRFVEMLLPTYCIYCGATPGRGSRCPVGTSDWHRFKGDDTDRSSSNCFLTTACVEYAGLRDDCEMLTLMREFRDGYVITLPNGKNLIKKYYKHAPKIVQKIKSLPFFEQKNIFDYLLESLEEITNKIEDRNYQEALKKYVVMYEHLDRTINHFD